MSGRKKVGETMLVFKKSMRRTEWVVLAALLLATISVSSAAGAELPRRHTDLQVTNLSCSSCLVRIRWGLRNLDGVIGMKGDLQRKTVGIDHAASLQPETIASTLENLGYPATILETRELIDDEIGAGPRRQVCGPAGCTNSRPCNATARAWRQLIGRWFGDTNAGQDTQP